ncbi:glycosyltransferase [Pseudarthrobacter sulfonivorans]|uniref:glycosyltransferase n=1 Tax=Pseudarthrobacter sulfonivorans TaxID=121292 RepID=UPI002106C641|nr:glycosyltransferase [Pseudarthrobacter sulfonivorans]
MERIRQVAVVIPVHNEEQLLSGALAAVREAADVLQSHRPDVGASILVALDSCIDGSAAVTAQMAAEDRRISSLQVTFRSVGGSRRAGNRAALLASYGQGLPYASPQLWLANTDADSSVPGHWLLRQVELADWGADAVLGTVEPDPAGTESELLRRWHARHRLGEDHAHVHGANLGVRASAYALAGGFPRLRSHEDRMLVDRLRKNGAALWPTDTIRVRTSGRTEARAPQGFGTYLLSLAREPAALNN